MNKTPLSIIFGQMAKTTEFFLYYAVFFMPGLFATQVDPSGFLQPERLGWAVLINVPQAMLLWYRIHIKYTSELANFSMFSIKHIAKSFVLAGILLSIMMIVSIIMRFTGLETNPPISASLVCDWSFITLLILSVLSGAYREELYFRAFAHFELGQAASPWGSLLVSSLLFGLPHAWQGGWPAVAGTALLGAFLYRIWQRERNIHIVALAHALYNLILLLPLVLNSSILS